MAKLSLVFFLCFGALFTSSQATIVASPTYNTDIPTSTEPAACIVDTTKMRNGLIGNVYYYPWADNLYHHNNNIELDTSFMQGGYASNPNVITAGDGHSLTEPATVATGVIATELSYVNLLPTNQESWDFQTSLRYEDYSHPYVPISNYLVSLNGYLIPNISGLYTFNLNYVDDGAYISIGNGFSPFGCCETPDETKGLLNAKPQLYNTSLGQNLQYQMNLVAGYAYPIKIVYVNIVQRSIYNFGYTSPLGVGTSDWSGLAFSSYDLNPDNICYPKQQTIFDTIAETSYTTFVSSSTVTTTIAENPFAEAFTETAIVAEFVSEEIDPYVLQTTTSYSAYEGSTSLAYSTEYSTVSSSILVAQVDVKVPYSTFSTITTTYDADAVTTSASTSVTTITPDIGTPYVSNIIIEDAPFDHTSKTFHYPGPYSTPYTFYIRVFTDYMPAGTPPLVETYYYVYTPYSTYSTVSTSFYNGNSTYVVSSGYSTISPPGEVGTPYVSGVAVVYVPEGHATTSVQTQGNFSSITTYSTSFTSNIGADGTLTVETIYYIGAPYMTYSTTETHYNEGSLTSGAETIVTTVTPASGDPYVSYIVILNVPESTEYVTIYTTGSYQMTTTYYEAEGTSYNDDVPTILKTYFVGVPSSQNNSNTTTTSSTSSSNTTTSSTSSTSIVSSTSSAASNLTSTQGPVYANTSSTTSSSIVSSTSTLTTSSLPSSVASTIDQSSVSSFDSSSSASPSEIVPSTGSADSSASVSASTSLSTTSALSSKSSTTSNYVQSQEITESIQQVTVITITSCGTKSCYPISYTSTIGLSGSQYETASSEVVSQTTSSNLNTLISTNIQPSYSVTPAQNNAVGLATLSAAKSLIVLLVSFVMTF